MSPNILPFDQWPDILKVNIVKGICVGSCVNPNSPSNADFNDKTIYAHAHCRIKDPYRGFICFCSNKSMKSRITCLHELAHLITSPYEEEHHGPRWFDMTWQLSQKTMMDRIGTIFHLFMNYMTIDFMWWWRLLVLPNLMNAAFITLIRIPLSENIRNSWLFLFSTIVSGFVMAFLSMKFAVERYIEKSNAD